jgi:ABC-type oligopeptide transport system ATPase subunit
MYVGKIVETGTVEQVFEAPMHPTHKHCWPLCRYPIPAPATPHPERRST